MGRTLLGGSQATNTERNWALRNLNRSPPPLTLTLTLIQQPALSTAVFDTSLSDQLKGETG